jgi:hypothetical protein
VRRTAAFLGIAAALAVGCRTEPPPPPQQPPAARPAERSAPVPPAAAGPRGDRHARAAARRSPKVKRVDGKLARCDRRAVVIRAPGVPALTLRVAPGTAVTLDGRPARSEALPPGADVRAAYRTGEGGRPTAISIEARVAPVDPPPGNWETSPDPRPDGGG